MKERADMAGSPSKDSDDEKEQKKEELKEYFNDSRSSSTEERIHFSMLFSQPLLTKMNDKVDGVCDLDLD